MGRGGDGSEGDWEERGGITITIPCPDSTRQLTSGSEKTTGCSCSRTAKQLWAMDSFCPFCALLRCGPTPFIVPAPLSREPSMGRCLGQGRV